MRWILYMLFVLGCGAAGATGLAEAVGQGGEQEVPSREGGGLGHRSLAEPRDHCFAVGPLVSAADAGKLQEAMAEAGIAAVQREKEVESGWDYWVYIPAPPSARAAARLLEELSSSGVESVLIADGELEGAIALGIFPDQGGALERHAFLSSLGYDARIHHMQRWAREYWLLADEVPDERWWQEVLSDIPKGIVREKIYPGVCKTVASPKRIP